MSFGLSRGKELITDGVGIQMADLPSFDEGKIDPRNWFNNPSKPFEIEIGSGKGTFLVQQAKLKPDTNFLGIEWTAEFYRYAADRIRRNQIKNVRMLHGDATEFLHYWCTENIAQVIHLYFSDPWPKKRHHKRRVLQDSTIEMFHQLLMENGELRLVTDHDDLWQWYEDIISRHENLFKREPFQPPESAGEGEIVGTNFERKYQHEGRPFHAMTLIKPG